MKPTDDLLSIAIHEAGHVAACLNLELPFGDVYLQPPSDYRGLVSSLVHEANIDYSPGVLSPEEESLSTNVMIAALAGPACEALSGGRTTFDLMDYEDLNEILDSIEYRFSNNNVRMTFARYCEAEAFALFEDDRRLWRYVNVLARELLRQKKLTYAQCLDLYSKEYLEESWVRKEVEEIRRTEHVEPAGEQEVKEQEGTAAAFEKRAERIERSRHEPKGQEQKPAREGEPRPAEEGAPEGERRSGRRRGRRRGRGRGRKREGADEQLPAVSGEAQTQPGVSLQDQPAQEVRPANNKQPRPAVVAQNVSSKEKAAHPALPVSAESQKAGETLQPKTAIQGGEVVPPAVAAAHREGAQEPVERTKKVLIKAKDREQEALQTEMPKAAGVVTPPPVAEQRPAEIPPVAPAAVRSAAAEAPKHRPPVGKKAEGKAVSNTTDTHPDSIWEEEKKPATKKAQAKKARPRPAAPVAEVPAKPDAQKVKSPAKPKKTAAKPKEAAPKAAKAKPVPPAVQPVPPGADTPIKAVKKARKAPAKKESAARPKAEKEPAKKPAARKGRGGTKKAAE